MPGADEGIKEDDVPMTATLTAPVEALLREQVAKGHLPSMDRALEVAVKTVDGRRASHAPESLLDEVPCVPGIFGGTRNPAPGWIGGVPSDHSLALAADLAGKNMEGKNGNRLSAF